MLFVTQNRRRDAGAPIGTPTPVRYLSTTTTITARDASQNFSKVTADVEQGATVLITRTGKTVAELRLFTDDPREDAVWRAKFEHMMQLKRETRDTGCRVGKITQDDTYGDAPIGSAVYARPRDAFQQHSRLRGACARAA